MAATRATCALFPHKPYAWLVRGTYRAPHMRGHTCSAMIYTARNSPKQAEDAAAESCGRWMVVKAIAPSGGPRL